MDLSIIIPVYKGEEILEELTMKTLYSFDIQLKYEIIFIYDQGNEKSWDIIKKLSINHNEIRGIRLDKNYGQHAALLTGMKVAKGDFIATMDEDMQYHPSDLKLLFEKQRQTQADLVYGIPEKYKHSTVRRVLSHVTHYILSYTVKGLNRRFSSLRLMKKSLADKVSGNYYKYTFLDAILSSNTANISQVIVGHNSRPYGESSWTYLKLIKHVILILIYYSSVPIISLFLGALLLVIFIVLLLLGFTEISRILILLITGSILFVAGVLAKLFAIINIIKKAPPVSIEVV